VLPAAHEAAGGVRVLAGVPYAAIPGVRPLELNLWLPPAATDGTRYPSVVFLHGGGWRVGSRHSAGPAYAGAEPGLFERVAAAGIAVASIDYRLSGEARWPAPLHDAKAAVRWLRARAGEVGIDPARVAAWGESAGGHLAELLGLTQGNSELEGTIGVIGPSSAVSAVAAWYAPSDLLSMATDLGVDPMDSAAREALLLGGPPMTLPDVAAQASPVAHVAGIDPGTAPAFLLLHGLADRLVPCVQSERLHAELTKAGVETEMHLLEGADHMWLGSPAAAGDALDRTIAFLHQQLSAALFTADGAKTEGVRQ
jgi:acetyl esterase/lipase